MNSAKTNSILCVAGVKEGQSRVRHIILFHSSAHDSKALKAATQQLDDATQTLAVMLIEKAMDESLERRGLV